MGYANSVLYQHQLTLFGYIPFSYDDRTSQLAADALDLLDEVGWTSRVHLVGISMGGMISLEMVDADRTRFQSLTLTSTSARRFLPTVNGGLWQWETEFFFWPVVDGGFDVCKDCPVLPRTARPDQCRHEASVPRRMVGSSPRWSYTCTKAWNQSGDGHHELHHTYGPVPTPATPWKCGPSIGCSSPLLFWCAVTKATAIGAADLGGYWYPWQPGAARLVFPSQTNAATPSVWTVWGFWPWYSWRTDRALQSGSTGTFGFVIILSFDSCHCCSSYYYFTPRS